jgi:hypothetical protein
MRLKNGEEVFMEIQTGPSMVVSKKADPYIVQNIAASLKRLVI